jgi:putative nucleotidyltransferase with HDIG domain
MQSPERKKSRLQDINRNIIRIVLLLITTGLSFAALVLPIATRPAYFPLREGDVASQDIQAPNALTYTSQVLTEQSRKEAELRVAAVYLPADPAIARQQIETLRVTLYFISTTRADSYASLDEKLDDLAALRNIQLNREEAMRILGMSEARWITVQEEALRVLEQVMRNTIQEGQLITTQHSLPTLISLTLPQDQASIVTVLVTPFIVANSLYSQDLTNTAREEAVAKVEPVTRSFASGEIIVRRGQIITLATWEALDQFNLIQTPNNSRDMLSSTALVITMAVATMLYAVRRKLSNLVGLRSMAMISVTFVVFLVFARLVIPNRTVIPYLFPIPAFGLTVASLFNMELGLVLTLVLSILSAFGLPNSTELTVYYMITTLVGISILGKGLRISSFFSSGLGVGAAGAAITLAYRLADPLSDLLGLTTLTGAAIFYGMASSSLTLILQFLFAQLLGLSTALQLLEISRPDHPLQQLILQNAPGSYQHSLQVAILAEQAAEKLGADPLLVRVGAIYHDAGKAINPSFFIENQIPGKLNPHDDMAPELSAATIIRHVTDGVQLARKYRMPSCIVDFMREHHGTLITRYQYAKAVEAAGGPKNVNKDTYRYPGPRPQSRETALLMLADGCQARARAELPHEEFELRSLVRKVIDFCQHENQLDDTRLTLRDLNIITDSFVKTLQNTYHPRIRYPEIKNAAGLMAPEGSPTSTEPPTVPQQSSS